MPQAPRRDTGPSAWRGWWATLSEAIDSRLWPVPVGTVVVAVVIGILLPRLDLIVDQELPNAVDSVVFNGGAETARTVLSSIAGSLITATSLTFSLTVVALQLASSQASPRVLRLFARDRQVHWTLAAFLGTFAYSLTVLRSVRSEDDDIAEFVPRLSVTLGFVLTLASVIMLVFFLAHLAAQLRVETMLKEIHAETDATIDLIHARNADTPGYAGEITPTAEHEAAAVADSSGFITRHDHDLLVRYAAEHRIVIQELHRVGENVVTGTPLARWWPSGDDRTDREDTDREDVVRTIRRAYPIGYERTSAQDVDFGVQQILDISLRALSPGVNDPTTAVHGLGHLSAITARLVAMSRLPAGLAGPDGQLCVITMPRRQADDVDASLTPLRHYGAEHPAVVTRFVQAVSELSLVCASSEVDAALVAQLDALDEQIRGTTADPASNSAMLTLIAEERTRLVTTGPSTN
ncbi:MAG: DUF2254 domain-containing protein [Microbacterium sp.]|uniref:DUF2254 domain-containing protein n=1 Tax=Microbacterium sp. TaxID=51671 RepID=UPI00271ECB8A|nr:DUF2254 domain-containing protein [Microbacterium sp.]MDO8381551.1 DUF2254 domain-containing protein [Microbacterium sp.]